MSHEQHLASGLESQDTKTHHTHHAPSAAEPKLSPQNQCLRVKPSVRRLRKGPIYALLCAIAVIASLATAAALWPRKEPTPQKRSVEPETAQLPIPEALQQNEESAADNAKPHVPLLGQPLPGNLGTAMVPPAVKPGSEHKPPAGTYAATSLKQQALEKAKAAPLFFSGSQSNITDDNIEHTQAMQAVLSENHKQLAQLTQAASAPLASGSPLSAMMPSAESDTAQQNMQTQKVTFLKDHQAAQAKDYLSQPLTEPLSPYEVKAGSIISASLITGINTDLPGEIIAQVKENVYDTVSGNILLIPQGSKLLATYNSVLTYGQERVLICWTRLILPNGNSIGLECAPGADLSGYAGVTDEVNHHYGRLITGVLFSSVLSASAPLAAGNISGQVPTWPQQFAANAGQHVNSVGQAWAQKNMNLQPTITVPPGWSLNVLVNKDMLLKPFHEVQWR